MVTRTGRSPRQHATRWALAGVVAAIILTALYQLASSFVRGIIAEQWPT